MSGTSAHGKLGGRLSGGSRLRKAVDKFPRVVYLGEFVDAAERASGGGGSGRRSSAKRSRPSAGAEAGGRQSSVPVVPTAPRVPSLLGSATYGTEFPALGAGSRGRAVVVRVKGGYGAGKAYDWEDVVDLCERLERNELKWSDLKKDTNHNRYKVPYATARRWSRDDDEVMADKGKRGVKGMPHWKVELYARRRKSLTAAGGAKGGGTTLGAAETKLAVVLADAALKGAPYTWEEVTDVVRSTAIDLHVRDAHNGELYKDTSNVTTLVNKFLARAAHKGIALLEDDGRSLGAARAMAMSKSVLESFRDDVIEPELSAFQKKHGPIPLDNVGNYDEMGIDLNQFASGKALFLKSFGNNVITPFDRAAHVSVVTGFVGPNLMVGMIILIGMEFFAPHPFKAQFLKTGRVFLAQSPNGWMDSRLKVAFFKLQVEAGIIGKKPTVVNCDGHLSNTRNLELVRAADEADCLVPVPPPHTSSGTQQCDQSAKLGAPIARQKAVFRKLVRRHVRYKVMRGGQVVVTDAELAGIYEIAMVESWDPALAADLNKSVGYYHDANGLLHWDLLRVVNVAKLLPSGDADVRHLASTRTGWRETVHQEKLESLAALECARRETEAASGAVARASESVIAGPVQRVPRSRAIWPTGLVIGSLDHTNELAARAKAARDKEDAAAAKVVKFWERYRPKIRSARARFKEVRTPSKLKVGEKHALIVDMTAKPPKAKNDKRAGVGDDEGAITKELRGLLLQDRPSLCPRTPDKAAGAGGDAGDDAVDDDAADDATDGSVDDDADAAEEAAAMGDDDAPEDDDDMDEDPTCEMCGADVQLGRGGRVPKNCLRCGAALPAAP